MRYITCILLLLTIAVTAGSSPAKTKPNPVAVSMEEYIRQAKASQLPTQTSEGSLYSQGGTNLDLFSDVKARSINDIVTIQIQESTIAENTADAQTNRKSATALAVPNAFGIETHNPNFPFDKVLTASTDMSYKGDGTTKRTGLVSAYLSARVRDVLPNGNLVVEGIKEIKVNNERQVLSLFGVVRPNDIGPNNVVLSTAVANMMVQIDGKGIISDNLNPGWLFRFLTKIWPF